ncbi:hypothetical protein DM02DRAFT_708062 [Periconia macrospinosa]|uniref:Uncharacterized protein n=1 Tax=Periconia macrospinosa TaxID=97972 RepID=A0A2V1DQN7_9PLEO|nr:hypothetical protein DM02DRAFT_708062 [Periconia macrospinosa]
MFLNNSIQQQLTTSLLVPRTSNSPPGSTTSQSPEASRETRTTEEAGENHVEEIDTHELLTSSMPSSSSHKRMSKKEARERHDADQYHWLKHQRIILAYRRKGEPPPPEKGIRETTVMEVKVEDRKDVEARDKALKDMEETRKDADGDRGPWSG